MSSTGRGEDLNIIQAAKAAFTYIRTDENGQVVERTEALHHIDLSIEEGSFVCILGHNGSGKSTLAKLFNGLNLPSEGTVLVRGMDTRNEDKIWDIRKSTGMVFQNPDNQIIASVVEEDVGFGPENIGVPTKEIWERVDRALKAVNMVPYRLKSPNRLSGGQKQRVAIAGTMAMLPKCIVLDEPTAMLDPSGRAEVVKTVRELNRQEHITIILITHYMEETVDADRIIVMDQGNVVMDGTPKSVFSRVEELKKIRMDVPEVTELAYLLRKSGMKVERGILKRGELCDILEKMLPKQADFEPDFVKQPPRHMEITDPVITADRLSYVYQPGTAMESSALKKVSFQIQRGIVTALIGHTGSGKSTLTQLLDGLLKATAGDIRVHFRDGQEESIYREGYNMRSLRFKIGLVFQYPEYQLFDVDVITDVMFGPKNQGLSETEARLAAEDALRLIGLPENTWKKSPFELSGGQKRRAAIAGVLAMKPEVLILDEPTAGLDPAGRDDLFLVLEELYKKHGMTILFVSHSMDDVARFASQVLVMDHGELKMQGTPEEVFRRYKELEAMGLGAPQMTYFIHDLKDRGIRFESRPDNVREMADAILDLYERSGGKLNREANASEDKAFAEDLLERRPADVS